MGVKTAISVPDATFAAAERAAAKLGISRSQFYARAAQRWIDALEGDELTQQINASLGDSDQDQDSTFISAATAQTLARSEW
jgi:hypothetical protein